MNVYTSIDLKNKENVGGQKMLLKSNFNIFSFL
jgi:hypothetical protein